MLIVYFNSNTLITFRSRRKTANAMRLTTMRYNDLFVIFVIFISYSRLPVLTVRLIYCNINKSIKIYIYIYICFIQLYITRPEVVFVL